MTNLGYISSDRYYLDTQVDTTTNQIVSQFVLLARTIPHLAWTAWPNGAVDFANDRWCAYTGLTQEQSKDWGWQVAIHVADLPELLMKWTQAIQQEKDLEGKMRIRCHDGSYRWHLVRAIPIRDSNNRVLKWFGTNTDIHDFSQAPSTTTSETLSADTQHQQLFASAESSELLAGRYQLLERLGYGGNGTVHKALHVQLEKIVAIKLINRRLNKDQELIESFKKEARAAASINHPNIVNITDFGITTDGEPFMVMDHIDGINLADYLGQNGFLDFGLFFEVFIQVSDGLAAAHARQIVHCDLKPGNVMIPAKEFDQNVCKVVDFGTARFFSTANGASSSSTKVLEVVGSPAFMSPEQCMGEELDHRSDIYSLGCVMYQSLTNQLPFDAPTVPAIFSKQVYEDPVSMRLHRAAISPELEQLVFQMLAKKVESRPASIQEVKKQLLKLYREFLETSGY
jgi:PAS domain S-box-containing protein